MIPYQTWHRQQYSKSRSRHNWCSCTVPGIIIRVTRWATTSTSTRGPRCSRVAADGNGAVCVTHRASRDDQTCICGQSHGADPLAHSGPREFKDCVRSTDFGVSRLKSDTKTVTLRVFVNIRLLTLIICEWLVPAWCIIISCFVVKWFCLGPALQSTYNVSCDLHCFWHYHDGWRELLTELRNESDQRFWHVVADLCCLCQFPKITRGSTVVSFSVSCVIFWKSATRKPKGRHIINTTVVVCVVVCSLQFTFFLFSVVQFFWILSLNELIVSIIRWPKSLVLQKR